MLSRVSALALAATMWAGSTLGGEVGYIEEFSLAKDRTVPLQQLIPGTEDYYYYHCLHYQNTEQWQKVDETLKAWVERYRFTPRYLEIENRQALLNYPRNPERALDLIRRRLNLQFNHQKEQLNQQANLPTALDPASLALDALTQRAFASHPNSVQGFEDSALERLASGNLTPEQRRHLLSRLQRPDLANLPKLIIDDLNFRNSGGFGQFAIHRQLLLAQLEELLKLKPELRNETNFVNAFLVRLQPSDDVNWRQNPAALEAYLDRQLSFVKTLAPVHNSLKAHLLYQRLLLDRSKGVYDRARFLEYLQLPRHVGYIEPKFMAIDENRRHAADLNADFSPVTSLPPVQTDEPLVRSFLLHFFVEDADFKVFAPYINDQFLKHLFAEAKIVNGLGDPEKWFSMLPPADYQKLKERIDLEFAPTNKTEYAVGDAVELDLFVKNVPTLIVKVFEINTQNYYRSNLREIGADINLDGLVANDEKTYTYNDPPLRRAKRRFEFPQLNARGVWVVDFIGNGVSSRAVIRKGKLRVLTRTSSAGQVFTVLDESNIAVPEAKIWLAGSLYTPDKNGRLITPFSNQPGRQPIVISQGDFASLEHFQQESENYAFNVGFHVDREELLSRQTAQLIARPSLKINGTPVSLKNLEDVRLTIVTTDLDNVSTSRVVPNFQLFEDRETAFEFQTPQRTTSLQFTLTAKVENLSQGKKVDLAATHTVSLNEIDRTDKIEDLHFLRINGAYFIDLLGKTGEAQTSRPVNLTLKLREFTQPVHASLQTDGRGRVSLGLLPGVVAVTATGPQGTSHTWSISTDEHNYPQTLHASVEQTILVPYMGARENPDRSELSLLELRGQNFTVDQFNKLTIKNGLLQIEKLPPGDFSLQIKPLDVTIQIRVTAGPRREGYALGAYRKLQIVNPQPLQLETPQVAENVIRLQLRNASKFARVHVLATRIQPAFSAYGSLSTIRPEEPSWLMTPLVDSHYVAGRNIGDEYRYIIDRKFQRRFPGNMLERPSLLLNPWAVRSTESGSQSALEGEMFLGGEGKGGGFGGKPGEDRRQSGGAGGNSDFADLDFLGSGSFVLVNALPNDEGVVTIKREDLGAHQDLLFVAVDPENTVSRRVTLPEPKVEYRDLRLARTLDPKLHFTQQKKITVVPAGQQLVLPDITSARFQAYDTLASVFSLYSTLNPQPHLAEFQLILEWPAMKTEDKRAHYSKHASHELSFFLFRKDPQFFRETIKPYLANKKDKTFLDLWLLEEDLTSFTQPWKYERLNTFERALLAQRLESERPETQRYIGDHFDLLPPNVERFNHLFRTALKGSSLETEDRLGFAKEQQQQLQEQLKAIEPVMPNDALGARRPGFFPAEAGPTPRPTAGAPMAPPAKERAEKAMEELKRDQSNMAKKTKENYRQRDGQMGRRGADKDADMNGLRESDEFFADEADARKSVRQYYRKLDKTMEWAENNYYKLLIEQQNQELITVNAFWNDFVQNAPNAPFLSTNMAEPTRNFSEMLMALALLDLPFEPGKHETKYDGARMTLTSAGPLIAFHEEILPAKSVAEQAPILVSQNFFRQGDRYRHVNNEQLDKFVSDEFLIDVVYGCHIVVTNPTSSPKKLDVLLQIPEGSMPVLAGQATRSVHLDLQPYHTQTLEYHFYFPLAGEYAHYPVHVGAHDEILAFAKPFTFKVVNEPTNIDKESWDYISQHAGDAVVVNYLKENNAFRTNLDRIAFRMKDKAFFQSVISLLTARHAYNNTLWSYGVHHDDPKSIRQFLQHSDGFVAQCGDFIDSPLLTIDPVARRTYEHLEYKPLVNARVAQLGKTREILNDRFLAQYQRLLKQLSYRRQLSDVDAMAVTYYLLLQDRIEEAMAFFEQVNVDGLPTRLQYDYCAAYLDFYREQPERAKTIAAQYANHPVDRWRNAFASVVAQADEITARDVKVVDGEDRTQKQTELAATNPSFSFDIEGKTVRVAAQRLKELRVNYYLMDVELLFSRNPFVQQHSGQFAFIRPNLTQTVAWPENKGEHSFTLPERFHQSNVLVEIVGGGETKSQACYANAMAVQTIENYGQVRVTHGDGRPLPKVYVKVYARMNDGKVKFYKDGYSDLRGRFDYTSLNTNELDFVQRFSLLVFSDTHGAVVREVTPPKQ